MRTIKFRGKSIDTNQWIYGNFIQTENGQCYIFNYHFIPHIYCPAEKFIEVDPKTIGQFTGICDINGNEIYEGDILKNINCINNVIYIIFWCDGRFMCGHGMFSSHLRPTNKESAYIGNIHDNPDLARRL